MQGKIALEEHFAIAETLEDSRGYFPERVWQEVKSRVMDIQDRRLARNGRERHRDDAVVAECAGRAGDSRSRHARTRSRAGPTIILPNRCASGRTAFRALPRSPMQDPEGAARELERCVKELGFRGALVNGFSQVGDAETVVYYDLPQYRPFWARSSGSTCRSICIRAIRCRATPKFMTATPGCWDRSGRSARRPRCMRCG
jgi:predicted TIM-barrel fold metal-dependent hydrolase